MQKKEIMEKVACHQYADLQLVTLYQESGDAMAFAELYSRYYPRVYKYCTAITRNQDKALDITQDVFLKAAEKLASLQYPHTFPAWLFRIARNKCLDYLKKARRSSCIDISTCAGFLTDEGQEDAREKEALLSHMEQALEQIDSGTKALLVAKYLQKASIADLQARYSISESAVKMRLARARSKMASFSIGASRA